MQKGQKQANLRNYNQSLIIDLIKSHSYSGNEIAHILHMSNSTVKYILDELLEIGILEIDNSMQYKSVGRSPICYRINSRFGCVVAVDFVNSKFTICDMYGVLLHEERFQSGGSFTLGHGYKKADVEEVIASVKQALEGARLRGWTLRSVSIATFGKVDTDSGEFMLVKSIDSSLNFKQMFSDAFGVPTCIYNDIDLAAMAESKSGKLKNRTKNALFISAGEGIANTLFVNDSIVHGFNYRGGEIGRVISHSEVLGTAKPLERIATVHSIKNNAEEYKRSHPETHSLLSVKSDADDVFDAYKKGDELCVRLVLDAAKCLGVAIVNILDILDCQTVILSGEILKFGEEFINTLMQTVTSNLDEGRNCTIEISSLVDSVSVGARTMGCNLAISSHLRKI